MEVSELQYVFMCILFLSTTIVGLAPLALGRTCGKKINISVASRTRILSYASCVGAGVFLFVCFMGLLPDADYKFHKILEELEKEDPSWHKFSEFPWGFFVVTCGFLVIFTIDKMVHAFEETKVQKSNASIQYSEVSQPVKISSSIIGDTSSSVEKSLDLYCDESCGSSEGHGVPSSVMFLVALGIHSIFEGVAIGLQTEKEKVTEFSVAVMVHEVVMAVTFGLEVSKSKTLRLLMKILYIVLFSLSIPLGIAVGVALQSTPTDNREIVSAICEAFATGIFLHVIFIEVLAQEFPGHQHHHHHRPRQGVTEEVDVVSPSKMKVLLEKILCIILGLSIMIFLSVFMHSHH